MFLRLGIVIFKLISLGAFFSGMWYIMKAGIIPNQYSLTTASAVQITQVYSEATYTALFGIGSLLVAIFIQLALYFGYPQSSQHMNKVQDELVAIRLQLSRISSLLLKQPK